MEGTSEAKDCETRAGIIARFIRAQISLLTFRDAPIARAERGYFLVLAFGVTWLAGCGRYWDHPNAEWWQVLGLGSVAYVVLLAALLWLVGAPLRLRGWSYSVLLLFVCMTSPPALLYAIPVERFLDLPLAKQVNFWFLAVVATWRVALLLRFLRVPYRLGLNAFVLGFLPLAAIVTVLTLLNLENATFEIMASGDVPETPHDLSYLAVLLLSGLSLVALIPLIFAYGVLVYEHRNTRAKDPARSGMDE